MFAKEVLLEQNKIITKPSAEDGTLISIGLTRKLKAKDVSLPVARAESAQFMGRGVGGDSATAIVCCTRRRPYSERRIKLRMLSKWEGWIKAIFHPLLIYIKLILPVYTRSNI